MNKTSIFEEFQQFIITHNLDIKDIKIMCDDLENSKKSEKTITAFNNVIDEDITINVITLSDSPKIKAKISNENIIYVDECLTEKNACSTTKIKFLERELWLNVCDCDDITTINLNIEINEKIMYNVPFIVKKRSNLDHFLEINEGIIHDRS